MIYPPRRGFAEHRALDAALRTWGGGIPASSRAFSALELEPYLERAFQLTPGRPPFSPDGAARVAKELTKVCRSSAASTPRSKSATVRS
jgi:hypothetical protein